MQDAKPASHWAEELLSEAVAAGITDGKRPQAPATREKVSLMVLAGMEKSFHQSSTTVSTKNRLKSLFAVLEQK